MHRMLPFLFVLAVCSSSAAYATDNYFFSGDSEGSPGDTVTVVVEGTNDVEILAYSIHFFFDPDVFDYLSSTIIGTRGAGAFAPTLSGTDSSATAGIIYRFACPGIPAGTGPFLEVTLEIQSDAPTGTTYLDLRDATPSLNRMTDCFAGTIVPTLTDGTFEVLGATPVCDVSPIALNFGDVQTGSSADLDFTIKNTGGGTLSGTVSETCDHYSLAAGGGAYSLVAGDSVVVTVRFEPTATGTHLCTIETGHVDCDDVDCTGTGYPPPACDVSPIALNFGDVENGSSADLDFTIKNTGGGTLSGTVSEACDHYSLAAGGGAYSLVAGDSVVVTVRFEPTATGTHLCTIETGHVDCDDVDCTGTGYPPPACDVSPIALNFGDVEIGEFADLVFAITNTGGGTLSGTVSESCTDYSIVSGASYSLTAGQSQDVTIRFSPTISGTHLCTIDTGHADCDDVDCTGTGYPPPACDVSPIALNFGDVENGSLADLDFTIKNTGGGTLSGTVSESCDHYSLAAGGGAYSLVAGDSVVVTVRFEPTATGTHLCTIETGHVDCDDVDCTGTGYPPPACDVSPIALNFGDVENGSSADLDFTIKNTGGGTLSGTVSEACDHYSLAAGGGAYSLVAGDSVVVTVRFEPTATGTHLCTIETGHVDCDDVDCTGTGYPPPACDVSPIALNFGDVEIGEFADLVFAITNTGGGTLSGTVSESCTDYSTVSGASYSLTAGQSQDVTIRFSPTISGTHLCTIDTGHADCDDVDCTGTGYPPPACDVSPIALNFGDVENGSLADLDFTIKNTGGGTLSGTVSESCDHYSLAAGGGAYSLVAGDSVVVTVRFEPTATGTHLCTIDTGHADCDDVSCTGVGYPPPACDVSPIALNFGDVQIGEFADLVFAITNTGGGTLSGTVSESCTDYSIVSGASYSLTAGQSQDVTIRFSPTISGEQLCTIDTGHADCDDVDCTGTGYPPPACDVSPIALNFGDVQNGSSADLDFTIKNTGGGTLSGTVSEACDHYSLAAGGGAYSLVAGDSVVVTVRFEPTATGTHLCTIDTGHADCDDVDCTGTGYPPPACDVSPIALNFGDVEIGEFADLVFAISNTGGGTLSGTVSEPCTDYSIVSGASYSLTAGQSQDVTIRFSPTISGEQLCTIDTGHADCDDVDCTGTGYPPPACDVSPIALNFGDVQNGSSADLDFTIKNTGGGTLSGTVSEACDHYSLAAGGGAYSLVAGDSVVVTVRFEPTATGTHLCTIETGHADCDDVDCTGTGYPPPACDVSPIALNFGDVEIGEFADLVFAISNTGGGTLSGTVSESCTDYSIVSGASYSLTAGQSQDVTIRFSPTISGEQLCTIETGHADCDDVDCTGTGYPPPACDVSPIALNFGDVETGEFADLVFAITNTGGGTLSGTVSESCTDYSIVSGASYSLTAGQSQDVTIRFSPTISGEQLCTIETGHADCDDVDCTGTGYPPPACDVSPIALNFGDVENGSLADLDFTIKNTGGGTLSGTVSESCDHYSLAAGGGAYSLVAGDSVVVTVRFEPTATGTHLCTIDTGHADCDDVDCTGTGYPPPACDVSPIALNFGDVQNGESADLDFTLKNTGGGTLSGTVSEACDHYSLAAGGGAYSLVAGDSVVVTVRFEPTATGTHLCTIDTGHVDCDDVDCTGTGYPPPACDVSPIALNFGDVENGSLADLDFTIKNTGGGTLSGTVSESCDHYSLAAGGGAYSLVAGDSVVVTVRFEPTATGTHLCTIDTGHADCDDVDCTGTGYPPPACDVSPIALNFGDVEIGEFADLVFAITNTGGGTLSGTVSESCTDYSIVSGASYSLTAGQSQDVTIRFSPTISGEQLCTIETGHADCDDVDCTGTGYPPPACDVSPIALNFGDVQNGESADLDFTIKNTGGGTLSGTVSESCDHYSLAAGGGAYSLVAGDSVVVTVRFEPTATGTHLCTIDTGHADCDDVDCTGTGYPPPACDVSPIALNFGDVQNGESADLDFTLKNTGGGTLSGTVSEACDHYSLAAGGGAYSLVAGDSVVVTVRFEPTATGTHLCTIDTGHADCDDVDCTGTGYPPPACDVSPIALNFGDVQIGEFADLVFAITNTGGGTLSGYGKRVLHRLRDRLRSQLQSDGGSEPGCDDPLLSDDLG